MRPRSAPSFSASVGLGLAALALLAARAAAQVPLGTPVVAGDGVLADVTGDGVPDLVDELFEKPGVWIGHADGSFGPHVGSPIALSDGFALGDVNADGHADLVEPRKIPTPLLAITVRFGDANGVFSDPQFTDLPRPPQAVLLADVDEDGALDAIVTPATAGVGLMVLRGHGDGTFEPAYEVAALNKPRVKLGDVDGDGHVDLVVLKTYAAADPGWELAVLFGHGDGTFEPPRTVSTLPMDLVAVGDVTGDARDDIAFLSSDYPDLDLLHVVSLGPHVAFEDHSTPAPWPPYGAASQLLVGQILAGGAGEVLAVEPGGLGHLVSIDARGAFSAPLSCWVGGGATQLIDLDRDGATDLLATLALSLSVTDGSGVNFGRGDGSFHPSYVLPALAKRLGAVDADLDGRTDVVICYGDAAPSELRRSALDGTLEPPVALDLGPAPFDLRVADVMGAQAADILTLGTAPGGGTALAAAEGHGDGSFGPPVITPVGSSIGMDLADFDNDGHTDVFVGGEQHVLLNAGDGLWNDLGAPVPGVIAADAVAGDFDADGNADLVLISNQPVALSLVRTLLGQGDGSFVALSPQLTSHLSAAQAFDVNGDGHLDIITHYAADFGVSGVFVLFGVGDGTFHGSGSLFPLSPAGCAFADLDGDGDTDMVSGGSWSIGLLAGGPGGLAQTATGIAAPHGVYQCATGDFDGDGGLDVAGLGSGGYETGALTLFRHSPGTWTWLGQSLAGATGFSKLQGVGTLQPHSVVHFLIVHAPPRAEALLVLGLGAANLPLHGGVLVPSPDVVVGGTLTDATGAADIAGVWPQGVPPGVSLYAQAWFHTAAGFSATGAVVGTTP